MYMCSFLVWKKTRVWIIASLTLKVTPYMIFIGPVFHNTIKTCLKCVGYCDFEWVENEMCRFAKDMSYQTHCTALIHYTAIDGDLMESFSPKRENCFPSAVCGGSNWKKSLKPMFVETKIGLTRCLRNLQNETRWTSNYFYLNRHYSTTSLSRIGIYGRWVRNWEQSSNTVHPIMGKGQLYRDKRGVLCENSCLFVRFTAIHPIMYDIKLKYQYRNVALCLKVPIWFTYKPFFAIYDDFNLMSYKHMIGWWVISHNSNTCTNFNLV